MTLKYVTKIYSDNYLKQVTVKSEYEYVFKQI